MSEPTTLAKPVVAETATGPSISSSSAAPFSYAQAARAGTSSSSSASTPALQPAKSSGTNTSSNLKKSSSILESATDSSSIATATPSSSGAAASTDNTSASTSAKKIGSNLADVIEMASSPSTAVTTAAVGENTRNSSDKSASVACDSNLASDSANTSAAAMPNDPSAVAVAATPKEDAADAQCAAESGAASSSKSPSTGTLQEAPIPTVNIWEQRAKEMKSRSTPASVSATSSAVAATASASKAAEHDAEPKRSRAGSELNLSHNGHRDDSKVSRKENKSDSERSKHNSHHHNRKSHKQTVPPVQDQSLWPTLDLANISDEKKKSQEKAGKSESRPQGKRNSWVPMPINPSVLWKSAPESSRRGGRTGRGGKEGLTRGNSYHAGTGSAGEESSQPPFEQGRKSRSGTTGQTFLPNQKADGSSKHNRHNNDSTGKPGSRDSHRSSTQSHKSLQTDEDAVSRDSNAGSGHHSQSRPQALSKPRQNRRFDGQTSSSNPPTSHSRNNDTQHQHQQSVASSAEQGSSSGSVAPNNSNATSVATPTAPSSTATTVSAATGATAPTAETAAPTDRQQPRRHTADNIEANPPSSRSGFSERRGFASRDGRGRGGRGGRGGSSSFNSNHMQGSHFTHGNVHGSSHNNAHGGIASGSFNPPQRSPNSGFAPDAQAFFPPNQGHRQFRGQNGRTNSVTGDSFARVNGAYSNGPAPIGPIQTTFPNGVYEHPTAPMSALMYNPYMDAYTTYGSVTNQLEYYLSVDNLCKDLYLRKHMDSKGFVSLRFLAEFNRMRSLTQDMEIVKLASYDSKAIEYRLGPNKEDLVRPVVGWDKWVLPMADRDASAQNAGFEDSQLEYPSRPQIPFHDFALYNGRYVPSYNGMMAAPLRSAPMGNMMNGAPPMEGPQSAVEFGTGSVAGGSFGEVTALEAPVYSAVSNPNASSEVTHSAAPQEQHGTDAGEVGKEVSPESSQV